MTYTRALPRTWTRFCRQFVLSLEPSPASARAAAVCNGAVALVFGVVLVLVLVTFRDYGVTWDERIHVRYGDRLLGFFARGDNIEHFVDYPYPGGFDVLGALVRKVVPLDDYATIHLFGALVGVVGMAGAWRLARFLWGPVAGLAAVVMLALTPVYYGHMFNNPKDLPFAAAYVWGIYWLVRAVYQFPSISRPVRLALGVVIGAALSVRIAGLLLYCLLALAIALYLAYQAAAHRSAELTYRSATRLARQAAVPLAVGWCLMVSAWPWAMWQPLHRPFQALTTFSNYGGHNRLMPFAGRAIRASDAPADYLLHYFGLKLPELIVLLVVGGLFAGAVAIVVRRRSPAALARNLALAVVGVGLVFPPVYAACKQSTLYDGLRHFLFLVPLCAVVAAGTAAVGLRWLRGWRPQLAVVAAVLILGGAGIRQVHAMVDLHPHEYVFFNQFAGGLRGAFGRYDTDYYGEAYREALTELAHRLWEESPDNYLNNRFRIGGCFNDSMVRYSTPDHFVRSGGRVDFWVAYTRKGCDYRHGDAPVMFDVVRDGVRLVRVRDVRPRSNGDGRAPGGAQ